MTTVDDPMSLDDALRIIRSITQYKTLSSGEIAEALDRVGWTDANHMRVMQQLLEVFSVVGTMAELIGMRVRDRRIVRQAVSNCQLEIAKVESAWMVAILESEMGGNESAQ